MKNLFDYATKELSQDAFLRWLFESWKDEEIRPVVKCLLKEFCNLGEEIKEITTSAQEEYIDIKVAIETISQRKIFLFIEDKTFSSEHKQLKAYDTYIDKISGEKHKVFYKTSKLSDDDKNGVDDANKTNGSVKWKTYDIKQIVELFEKHAPYQNLILQHYVAHVQHLYQCFYNYQSIPIKEWRENFLIFTNYSDDVIKKYCGSFSDHYRSQVYQGKYAETYIQKNLPNNITVELGLFFRDWGYSAWIKVWHSNLGWREPFLQKEEVKKMSMCNYHLKWENKQLKNRMKIIKKPFTEELTYEEFNAWIEDCIEDYLGFAKKVAIIPKWGQ